MVYKYYPSQRCSIFPDLYVALSPPSLLNDPTECKPSITLDHIDRHIQALVRRNFLRVALLHGNTPEMHRRIELASQQLTDEYTNHPEILIGKVHATFQKHINADIGILSLSKCRDSNLMWAHYCSSHEGFVLGFDEANDFFKHHADEPRDCGILRDVVYSNDRITVDVDDIKLPPELLFTKKPDWSYEQEVRMIRPLANADKVVDKPNHKVFLFRVPKTALKEVIFGIKCPDSVTEFIRNAIAADAGYVNVAFLRAEYDNNANLQFVNVA